MTRDCGCTRTSRSAYRTWNGRTIGWWLRIRMTRSTLKRKNKKMSRSPSWINLARKRANRMTHWNFHSYRIEWLICVFVIGAVSPIFICLLINRLCNTIENLESRCEELGKQIDELNQIIVIERRKKERLMQENKQLTETNGDKRSDRAQLRSTAASATGSDSANRSAGDQPDGSMVSGGVIKLPPMMVMVNYRED